MSKTGLKMTKVELWRCKCGCSGADDTALFDGTDPGIFSGWRWTSGGFPRTVVRISGRLKAAHSTNIGGGATMSPFSGNAEVVHGHPVVR